MSRRITYEMVKGWINEWNENHPETQMYLSAYDDYYHLSKGQGGNNIIVEKTPGRLWESFTIWKYGYYAGRESVGDDRK